MFKSLARLIVSISILSVTGLTSAIAADANPVPNLPARKSPPIIILKLDDLPGTIAPNFKKMADILEARNIKGSFGVISAVSWPGAKPVQDGDAEYVAWVKKLHDSGRVEFWCHGWDHAGHMENGESHCEFHGRTYEDQKARFERCQKVAFEKFGFHYQTFGPGGGQSKYGTYDEATAKALQDDPYIKAWLFPTAINEIGKALAAQGKVMILDRQWDVNLEKSVGNPDFNLFVTGYAKHPDREYFVLQGHPNPWNDAKFEEVTKIIDFLIAQKAVFMTPSEFVAFKRKK